MQRDSTILLQSVAKNSSEDCSGEKKLDVEPSLRHAQMSFKKEAVADKLTKNGAKTTDAEAHFVGKSVCSPVSLHPSTNLMVISWDQNPTAQEQTHYSTYCRLQ